MCEVTGRKTSDNTAGSYNLLYGHASWTNEYGFKIKTIISCDHCVLQWA